MKKKSSYLLFLILLSCAQLKNSNGQLPPPESLEEAVHSSSRAEENSRRDEYQHPLETLQYFGLKPNMTVVEITPGAGYFTEILAPYLAKNGQYAMVVPRLTSRPPAFMVDNERKLQEILLRHQDVQNKTRFIPFEPLNQRNKTRPDYADLIVSFNNVHNWVAQRMEDKAFQLFYDILKPGGVLGIVQHRLKPGKPAQPKSGYMTEAQVIALANRAGLKFIGRSEINANPKDTADYPDGVWTLPPFYRLGDKDRDKYEDIGESDRMTLKFMKP
jgi:predicted methyltransferase